MTLKRYRVAEVVAGSAVESVRHLQFECLPDDEQLDPHKGHWWVVTTGGQGVAFAGLLPVPSWPGTGYLCRAGVTRSHRGHGLQRRMIAARIAKAKSLGMERVITTTYDNPQSSNNIIAAGFRMYQPQTPWGATGTCYWVLSLNGSHTLN